MKVERKKERGREGGTEGGGAGETRFVVAALERSESVDASQITLLLHSNAATAREKSLHKWSGRCRSGVREVAA